MRHKVSEKYIAIRRGGPRRVFFMMSSVLALFAFLALSLPNHPDNTSSFGSLIPVITIAGAIAFFQSRRMSKATTELESLTIEATSEGIAIETPGLRQVLNAALVLKVLLYRTYFSPSIYCIGLQLENHLIALPPLEQNDALIAELRLAAPHAQFLVRRQLIV